MAYPLLHSAKLGLKVWLDTLPVLAPSYLQGRTQVVCVCCNFPTNHTSLDCALQTGSGLLLNQIIQLPCGCKYRRGCIEALMDPGFNGEDKCPTCGFVFFLGLKTWIEQLEPVDITGMKEDDRRCGICRLDYGEVSPSTLQNEDTKAQAEVVCTLPKKTPCGHIFGQDCLRRWLETKGSENICPACRHVFFDASPRFNNGEIPPNGISPASPQAFSNSVVYRDFIHAPDDDMPNALRRLGPGQRSFTVVDHDWEDGNVASTQEQSDEEWYEEEERRYRSELERYNAGNEEPERFWRGIGGAR